MKLQICVIFTPVLGEIVQFDEHMFFKMGKNHHLGCILHWKSLIFSLPCWFFPEGKERPGTLQNKHHISKNLIFEKGSFFAAFFLVNEGGH